MANCGLLKNDDGLFLLNDGGVLLLNDSGCGTEAGVEEGQLSATGAGAAAFVGVDATPVVAAVFSATGTATATLIAADAGAARTVGGGNFDYHDEKKRKKRAALAELDALVANAKARTAPWQDVRAYGQEQALYREALNRADALSERNRLAQIEAEILNLRELLAQRDEEDALILLMLS
jgi:hypothetical protein